MDAAVVIDVPGDGDLCAVAGAACDAPRDIPDLQSLWTLLRLADVDVAPAQRLLTLARQPGSGPGG